jgi:hypothetical protein
VGSGGEVVFHRSDLAATVGLTAAMALWAVIGAGLGATIRNQVAVAATGLIWILMFEKPRSWAPGRIETLPAWSGRARDGPNERSSRPSHLRGSGPSDGHLRGTLHRRSTGHHQTTRHHLSPQPAGAAAGKRGSPHSRGHGATDAVQEGFRLRGDDEPMLIRPGRWRASSPSRPGAAVPALVRGRR